MQGPRRDAPARPPRSARLLQIWVLLSICTLSALPWMVIEFKKHNYSVHYQGEERGAGRGCCPFPPSLPLR